MDTLLGKSSPRKYANICRKYQQQKYRKKGGVGVGGRGQDTIQNSLRTKGWKHTINIQRYRAVKAFYTLSSFKQIFSLEGFPRAWLVSYSKHNSAVEKY